MDWVDICRVELMNASGVWVDITVFVRFKRMEFRSFRGRANETDQIGPGALQLGLDNSTGIFTPGVSSAALTITLGMPVRVFDVVGYRSFPVFSGTLEMPDSTEILEGVDNLITVTAVDRKQLMDNGRTFISTLAEHVLYNGGSALVGYWPLLEAGLPFGNVTSTTQPNMDVSYIVAGGINSAISGEARVTPNGGTGPVGDDGRPPLIETAKFSGGTLTAVGPQLASNPTAVIHPGQVLTLAAWYTPQINTFDPFADCLHIQGSCGGDFLQFDFGYDTTVPGWVATVGSGAGLSGTITVVVPYGNAVTTLPIAIRYGYNPSVFELWLGAIRYTGTLSGSTPAADTSVNQIRLLSNGLAGSVGHAQLYAGNAADFDFTKWLAQITVGHEGLAGQRTDERIRTILSYAGSATAALDEGSTYMQQATLAGKKPGAAIDEAVATERGRFFIANGVPTFHARTRAYNL